MSTTRRAFIQAAGTATALGLTTASAAQTGCQPSAPVAARTVRMFGDGIGLTPTAYASLLDGLCRAADVERDNYLLGGAVAAFERRCAQVLGKEMAVFMPSGTLANQLAIRALAGDQRRVIVPERSHVYNDTGDACQTLANLNLLPLARNRATFSLEDVRAVLAQTAGGRVATGVGALLIESPIRRLRGEMFDWGEARRIAAFAREQGIGTHLDGARLFIASAYTGISPAEYAAPFDTVYVSLWKYFNSGIGAILAGPKSLLADMYHARRMFGGNLYHGWAPALVAGHFMNGFPERLRSAVDVSEQFFTAIEDHPNVSITRIQSGTNVARMRISGPDLAAVRKRLADRDILLGGADDEGAIIVGVNETWNRKSAAEMTGAFVEAVA